MSITNLKILHFADTHLDGVNYDEKEVCLGAVADAALSEQPDLIVFAGDAFHSHDVRAESQAVALFCRTIKQLSAAAPVAVLTGTASHDGGTPRLFNHFHDSRRVLVSDYPEQIFLFNGGLYRTRPPVLFDAVISMCPPPTKQFLDTSNMSIEQSSQAVSQAMNALFTGFQAAAVDFDCPHILVGHFNVSGAMISPTQMLIGKDIEVSRAQLELCGADLVCLGHIHKAQQIGDSNIFFCGSTQSNTWGELDDKGFYIHDLHRQDGVWKRETSRFIKTPSRKRIWIKHDFTAVNRDNVIDIDNIICCHPRKDYAGAVVRVDLKCYKDQLAQVPAASEINTFFESAGARRIEVNITKIARETVRSQAVVKAATLADKIKVMASLRQETLSDRIIEKANDLEKWSPEELKQQWESYTTDIQLRAEALEKEAPCEN